MTIPLGSGPSGRASGLKSTGYKQLNLPTQNPQQQELSNFLHSILGSQGGFRKGLSDLGSLAGGSQEAFDQLERPALRQFSGLQGGLASRFSGGFGTGGASQRNSSGFQNTMGEQAQSFAEQLQSQRLGLQQNALQQLLGLSESLLGRPTFQSSLISKKKPFWQELLSGGLHGLGSGMFGGF